jgi:electron transfer flavoprotein alpha subunit
MSNVLVVAEMFEGALKKATLTAVTFARDAAQRTGGQVHAVVHGQNVGAAAEELAGYVSRRSRRRSGGAGSADRRGLRPGDRGRRRGL